MLRANFPLPARKSLIKGACAHIGYRKTANARATSMARMQTIQQLGSSLHQRQKGFSLLEVLITLTITALALLGAADLQLRAMQTGQSSQARTQAVLLASDLVEKIEANKPVEALNPGAYQFDSSHPAALAADCAASLCSYAQRAAYDLSIWNSQIPILLPQASTWTVSAGSNANGLSTYTIAIHWNDRKAHTNNATAGSMEPASYQATRTIY